MATILYVDDEPSVGMIVADTLERAGHTPIGARSVPEALQVLERSEVDLIISDYRMPGLTGLEFLQLLAREGYDIPLIMLTGYASIEHAVASIKAGAIDYITKPVRPQQLELAVDQALEFVRLRREKVHSSGRIAARCCSTKFRRCDSTCRPSCCACCRSRSSSASAAHHRSRSMCASSRRQTATSHPKQTTGPSGRTSTIDCRRSR